MGLFDWLRRLLGAEPSNAPPGWEPAPQAAAVQPTRRTRVRLHPLRFGSRRTRPGKSATDSPRATRPPYRFARPHVLGGWLDLSRDQDDSRLERFGLPSFRNPEELARWLGLPVGQLAWLTHRFDEGNRPATTRQAHYHFHWVDKRQGGKRLIESPKKRLKTVQTKILRGILDHVPPHSAAHGFVAGRSIQTNSRPHLGQRVVVKFDLQNFYPSVTHARVVAIFRGLGYSREAAVWLGRLTTSRLPDDWFQEQAETPDSRLYSTRRLPQGAPTSPALANLSAFVLDLRLAGLARTFGANYTRYADDLTFSGDDKFLTSLAVFIPLVQQIVKGERFKLRHRKFKVIRNNQRQLITGVVVNELPNVTRESYDRLKAILTNCIRRGPSTQNHVRHENFAAHLRGRIAHVSQLHPDRGRKLAHLFDQIDWNR